MVDILGSGGYFNFTDGALNLVLAVYDVQSIFARCNFW